MDRHERRQQRMRGAGASTVQENFGFSFAGLAPKPKPPAKQASPLPPRPSSHRSSSVYRHATPRQRTVTPKLGKRKRPSPSGVAQVQADVDDGEPDDLSPDRDNHVHSVEKSRRVIGTASPLRDPPDEEPDELSIMEDGPSTAKRVPPAAMVERTPIADRISNMVVRATVSPNTPSLLPTRHRTSSASRFGPEFTTPGAAPHGEDSEDELSTPMVVSSARVVAPTPRTLPLAEDEAEPDQDVDELSSPHEPPTQRTPAHAPAKKGRPRRMSPAAAATVQATPTASKPRRKPAHPVPSTLPEAEEEAEEDAPDELSPEFSHIRRHPQKGARHEEELPDVASAEESDNYEPDVEHPSSAPKQKPAKIQKPSNGDPPRKRQKFGGPKHPISVMRIKGSTVRGVTVADTTRTILEQTIDHRVGRMVEKLQRAQDSSRRKQIRNEVNLVLAFKESLNEKLLDLQDANDTLSAGFQKRKLFKSKNIGRRKKILALQNSRQEIALELDDEQAEFDADKEKKEAETKLSTNMFEIQAAIQSGRERARQLGREDEGPNVPLSMFLETVGRSVGSVGGGLLIGMREFNNGLERAAGWLEGRA
jgi:hypothetical protein